jgi:hypothetical protein
MGAVWKEWTAVPGEGCKKKRKEIDLERKKND